MSQQRNGKITVPNKKGIIFVIIGAVLILSALSLYLYNEHEDKIAGQEAENLLSELQSAIGTKGEIIITPEVPAPEREEPVTSAPKEVLIQGYSCIGYISIPSLGLELPVLSEWDYERLKAAPCRQFGSAETNDLVIAAHNYAKHFGKIKNLSPGDRVYFTDVSGNLNCYAVKRTETLNPEAVDVIKNSESDLVLYTCTKSGATRVTVFCERAKDVTDKPTSNYSAAE